MVANTFTNNLNKTKHEHCMSLDLKKFHNTNNKLIVNLRSKHIVWKTLNVKNIDPWKGVETLNSMKNAYIIPHEEYYNFVIM